MPSDGSVNGFLYDTIIEVAALPVTPNRNLQSHHNLVFTKITKMSANIERLSKKAWLKEFARLIFNSFGFGCLFVKEMREVSISDRAQMLWKKTSKIIRVPVSFTFYK